MQSVLDESKIDEIVRQVMAKMGDGSQPKKSNSVGDHGIFETMDEAMAAVELAQQRFSHISLAQRKLFIQGMRQTSIQNSQMLSEMAVSETKLGRVADKILKNVLAAEKTPGVEDLQSVAFQGDDGLTVEEYAPFGTVLAILPVTNPAATVINNAISMISAGNTVVFAPHPSGRNTSFTAIQLLNQAIEKAGGPPNLMVAIKSGGVETVRELMQHPQVKLICATGGKEIVRIAMSSGKRAIGAAAGNPPVVVDETANPEKAAREIVAGSSFDNNLPCTCEKEIIVVEWMADALLRCFGSTSACVLDASHLPQLEKVVLHNNHPNKNFVGRNAAVILKELGIPADDDLRMIIVETDKDHPFVRLEMMMPVLPLVRVGNFEEAVDVAVEVEGGNHHTALIHSANINHMSELNKAINTTIFVKNAPSYAGLGFGGEGYTTFTIAGASGEGMTTARTFSRRRRCSLVGAFSLV
jgi:propionaldehyde dehydrogenase